MTDTTENLFESKLGCQTNAVREAMWANFCNAMEAAREQAAKEHERFLRDFAASADTPPTQDELDAIAARAALATPGPWTVWSGNPWHCEAPGRGEVLGHHGAPDEQAKRDVAHAAGLDPTTTLRLVKEIVRLRKELAGAGGAA